MALNRILTEADLQGAAKSSLLGDDEKVMEMQHSMKPD